MNAICVFCGSSAGDEPVYAAGARRLAAALIHADLALVYGGGSVGLMGILADEMLAAGGQVTGVIPRMLWDREVGHRGLSDLRIVETMHERKAMMVELSDGFIAMPGGIGTLEEFFEVWTWAQLGVHHKPCGILNISSYFDTMLSFIDGMKRRGFLRPEHRDMILLDADPTALLGRMAAYQPPAVAKWVDRAET